MSLTPQDLADIKSVVVDGINDSFVQLSAPRFDAIEIRMDQLEAKMDSLEVRMNNLETKVTAIDLDLHNVNRRLGIIESHMQDIEDEIETVKNDVTVLYELTGKSTFMPVFDKTFDKLSNDDKLRKLHAYILNLARLCDVQLQ